MFVVSILINVGMWFERFVIIVTSLHRDYLPSSWGYFRPTIVDIGCFVGSLGLFFTLFALFIRWIPQVAMFEVKAILPGAQPSHPPRRHAERHAQAGQYQHLHGEPHARPALAPKEA
jgi:molybdopterin-containing oxidoreductase family membrane subunit